MNDDDLTLFGCVTNLFLIVAVAIGMWALIVFTLVAFAEGTL